MFQPKDRVVVTKGAFAGLVGTVAGVAVTAASPSGTCRVLLRLWRESLPVELPPTWLMRDG